ncbi:hypothetical protein TraAM80_00386 [Trypanosoma rangeli]|uniref:Cell division control protein n=1 Tax=Trypanosoma rangeli TaxID=5698 RepID=A0A422P3X7_TRYRA|nr:uncharacterized protein TraAM80_00386 [Trypanosoma rangeli]RNF12374.1 hypothetical protein TraAM80_00386 [Trypanosoma rangeli]|eukprot:RNF12374.1 hypothetical protein TraAM80_00386 [Trypanosoma rangeli]
MEKESLLGREQEYNAVHEFIEERILLSHCRSLFVFGACGCGKTSTILRAMRCVSSRPMACDKVTGRPSSEGRGSCGSNSGGKSNDIDDKSPSPAIEKRRPAKRGRADAGSMASVDSTEDAAMSRMSCGRKEASPCSDAATASHSLAAASLRLLGGNRRIQCHYINCADMTSQQLCAAIACSFRVAQPRLDAQSRNLLGHIETLPQTLTKRRGAESDAARKFLLQEAMVEQATEPTPVKKSMVKAPLHVLALDEVEYVRAGARGLLTALTALSVEHASQLALVFISNQRELVHVPYTLLKELPFEAYSTQTLERIGASIVASADFTQKERAEVQLSPGLIAYIAKKAIHEYSGDVRQVVSMCRRLVYTAQQGILDHPVKQGEMQKEATPQRRSGSGVLHAGAVSGNASPVSPAAVVTLAQSQKVLRGSAVVGDRVFEYVAGMPEQMLYVLSCLVVLTLRQRRDKQSAQTNVAGVTSSTRRLKADAAAGRVEPGTFAMREVHRMYTALMGQQRFPLMNAAGIMSAIDSFADLGIISRPQRRGNEELFSFNGTWSLESMQSALTARGEALRQERIECGLDGSENRFSEVLRELKTIAGL